MRYIDRPAPDEILKLYSGGMNDGRIKKADTPVSGGSIAGWTSENWQFFLEPTK